MISIHLVEQPGGVQILDLTPYVESAPIAHAAHGDGDLAISLQLPSLGRQLALLERPGTPWVEVYDTGELVYCGRVEDPQASSQGVLTLTTYGPWRALTDARDTALWSDTSVAGWFQPTAQQIATSYPGRFRFDTNNRLNVEPENNSVQGNTPIVGYAAYAAPSLGSRLIQNIAFDYYYGGSTAGWIANCQSWTAPSPINTAWTVSANLWIGTVTAAPGAAFTGSICAPLTTLVNALTYGLSSNNAAATFAGQTGDVAMRITNLRITTNPLAVDTTLSAGAILGATSITVVSATNIVVGQSLYLGGTNPERVTVTSVAGATIGITALVAAKSAGNSVRAQRVLASDIAAHLASIVSTLNPGQLRSATTLIQQSTLDRRDVAYGDASPASVLETLATGEQLACGVSRNQLLYLRPRDQAAWTQTYAVDVSDITIGRSIESLRNHLTATYEDASGRPVRTAAATAGQSVARWGLTRQAALNTTTTNAAEAEGLRDLALADTDDPPPQLAIAIRRLTTPAGAPVPLRMIESGDTFLIRNLVLGNADTIDQLGTVRVARRVFDPATPDEVVIELENPPATLEVALARSALAFTPTETIGQRQADFIRYTNNGLPTSDA